MAKYQRRMARKLAARAKACVEARAVAVQKNPRLAMVVDRAFKMPGSRRLRKH